MENPNILAPAYVVLGIVIIGCFVLILPLITVIVMKFKFYAANYKTTYQPPLYTGKNEKINTTLADPYCDNSGNRKALYEPNCPVNTIPVEELRKYIKDSQNEVFAKNLK